MTNLPSTFRALPPPTPCVTSSMSPEECAVHRQKIAFEVEVVLDGYWHTQPPVELKAAVMADWADELEDWTLEQVRWGLRAWRRDNPRRKPNPGDIVQILKRRRGEEYAAKARALPKADNVTPIVTDEARARNLELLAQLLPAAVQRVPEVKE